jgi:hypothetical protein
MDSREFAGKPKREIPDVVNCSAKSVGWASESRLDWDLGDFYEKE